jgi:hypothetical protein
MEISPLLCLEELFDPLLIANAGLEADPFDLSVLPNLVYRNDLKLKLTDKAKDQVVALGLLQRAVSQDVVRPTQRLLVISPRPDIAAETESLFKRLSRGVPETRTALVTENFPLKCQVIPTQAYRLHQSVRVVVVTCQRYLLLLERLVTLQRQLTDFQIVWLQGLERLLVTQGRGTVTPSQLVKILGILEAEPSLFSNCLARRIKVKSLVVSYAKQSSGVEFFNSLMLPRALEFEYDDSDRLVEKVMTVTQVFKWLDRKQRRKRIWRLLANDETQRYHTVVLQTADAQLKHLLQKDLTKPRVQAQLSTTQVYFEETDCDLWVYLEFPADLRSYTRRLLEMRRGAVILSFLYEQDSAVLDVLKEFIGLCRDRLKDSGRRVKCDRGLFAYS